MHIIRRQKGFTLIEVVVAMAAFTIIILGVMQIMAQSTKSYRSQKLIQANLETAQFVLNLMAKELRTSSVLSSTSGTPSSTITFFDYSQNLCIQYRANNTTGIVERRAHPFGNSNPDVNRASCNSYSYTEGYVAILSGLSGHRFQVDPSAPMPDPHAGRVSVSLSIGTGGTAATAQTTVSLRDYNYIGI
jgi:prepilin-type N-terminal cleavage/methylation domain-containing protein